MPLNLLTTQLTVANVGCRCLTALEFATPTAEVMTALASIESFVPFCPLYFSEYGHAYLPRFGASGGFV